jgi:hypothetical protein
MIAGIMQPYLFPYIGYFQLMRHCDVFVVLDDVQYMSGGWINRNRILLDGHPRYITKPVQKDDHTATINRRRYVLDRGETTRVLRRIEAAYRKAPRFRSVMPLLEDILSFGNPNVADFNHHAIARLVERLEIRTRILRSSAMEGLGGAKGTDRVIAICKSLGAVTYVNPIGGTALYSRKRFAEAGIDLQFLEAVPGPYPQFAPEFVPYMSIIDIMMHNDPRALQDRLAEYRIVEPLQPS